MPTIPKTPVHAPAALTTLILALTALSLVGCDDGGCPPENYPSSFEGYEDHTYWRGSSSSDDFGLAYVSFLPEYDDDFEPTGRYELLLGPCTWIVQNGLGCSTGSEGVVSLFIAEPAGGTCTWNTTGGDRADFDANSYAIWWGPDSLEIDISGPVVYTGSGGTDNGSATFTFSGTP